jgi:rifampicin phosphotransferase
MQKIESRLGYYQDIEWTMQGNRLVILQSRPVTTFRSKEYPEQWFRYDEMKDTLLLSEDKALSALLQDIKEIWYQGACKGQEFSSKGKNGRYRICRGYFYSAWDERDWEKRVEFRAWLEELLVEGKNIFQDIQLPQILSLREELEALFDREVPPEELVNILEKAIQLFKISVEINISAVDGGCVPLEAFEKYCRNMDSSLSQSDFYDLVYGISKLSEERQAAINLALLVKSEEELIKVFETYQYDEILYAHLRNFKMGRTLLNKIDEYLKEYGLMTVNGQWQFNSPILWEHPWFVISKIRACLGIDNELFFNSRNDSLNNKVIVAERLTADMNARERDEFSIRLKGAEKAFLVNDDHCFYLDLSAIGYMRLTLVKIADLLLEKRIIDEPEAIQFLHLEEIKDILNKLLSGASDTDCKDVIDKRKIVYKQQIQVIPPGYIGVPPALKDSKEALSADETCTVIKGVSGLRKKVSGKVKVISNNFNIQLDEPVILVLRSGHACYFLPFLSHIKGLIYDGGSPFDHPGIIARELDIPSLYNTQNATQILKDGDEVELDGVNGCVVKLLQGCRGRHEENWNEYRKGTR